MAETRAHSLLELTKQMEKLKMNQTKQMDEINDKISTICNILAELRHPPPDPTKRPMEQIGSSSAVLTPHPSPTQPSPSLNQMTPPIPEPPDFMIPGQRIDGKGNLAKELCGESLHLSKSGNDDHGLENLDDPFYGSSDEESSEARELDKENELRHVKFHTAGYREGIVAGKEAIAQEGYKFGYKESVLAGYKFGVVKGVSSALAFLPDDLREKLIDEQETREKFQKLHNSVHSLSTEVAMKLFYGSLTTKQGEEKSGEKGPDSGFESGSGVNATTDLGSYVTELSSLLDKSPKIEVVLDT